MRIALVALAVLLATPIAALIANRALLTAPPGIGARLVLYLTHNVAEVSPDSRFPELRSPRFRMPAGELLAAVATLASELGFRELAVDEARLHVSAVAVSSLFGFRDDLAIEVRADGETCILLARSASRLGRGDLGANQHHLRRLLEALQARLAGRIVPQ